MRPAISICLKLQCGSGHAAGLERTSLGGSGFGPSPAERSQHPPRQQLVRHVHPRGFAAVVLAGGYVEAGDTGRHSMEAGDVLLHQAWESHLDRVDVRGAEVLMLALADDAERRVAGRIADPDGLVRLAERDERAALEHLLANLAAKPEQPGDWPDLLARDIHDQPMLCLEAWADAHGLHPGSVSRGFRQVFGLTPAAYRLAQRTGRVMRAIRGSNRPLSSIAQDWGFADQAHMNRSVRRLAGVTPAALRGTDTCAAEASLAGREWTTPGPCSPLD